MPERDAIELNRTIHEMEREGVVSHFAAPTGSLEPITKKSGALERFLGSR